jgi:hypothetical protein
VRDVVLSVRRLAVALILVLLGACGGGSASGTDTTTPVQAGPPLPSTTLPAWIPPALGVAGEDALLEVIRHDLAQRGLQYAFDPQAGTISLADGRVVPLSTVAKAASESDPTTWPNLVARTFDALLSS